MPNQKYIDMLKQLAKIRGSTAESWQNAVLHNYVRENLAESGAKMNSKTHHAMVKLAFDVWSFAKREFGDGKKEDGKKVE
ncbi:MAG: hypothetical protein JW943_07265 [Deltaproteobacteria bacterium]|nr:hypothetical protein [Deltaproteobacteria bacterium]